MPGIGLINPITILAAIGDVTRFPEARKLVGYAGLGASVHDSGQSQRTGGTLAPVTASAGVTKQGRRDLRFAMVEAAHHASQKHPHWKGEFERLEPRLGRSKAVVAIARKLLIAVWHVLTEGCADKYADPEKVAYSFFHFAYKVGVKNLPGGVSATQFTRDQLDKLGIGEDLTEIPHGTKRPKLPKSRLTGEPSTPATGVPEQDATAA
jgi:transposase